MISSRHEAGRLTSAHSNWAIDECMQGNAWSERHRLHFTLFSTSTGGNSIRQTQHLNLTDREVE